MGGGKGKGVDRSAQRGHGLAAAAAGQARPWLLLVLVNGGAIPRAVKGGGAGATQRGATSLAYRAAVLAAKAVFAAEGGTGKCCAVTPGVV